MGLNRYLQISDSTTQKNPGGDISVHNGGAAIEPVQNRHEKTGGGEARHPPAGD